MLSEPLIAETEFADAGDAVARTLSPMNDDGALWRRQDALRRQAERRHQMMRAIRQGDTPWALHEIAGPDAAIDYLDATQGTGPSAPQPSYADVEDAEPQWPHTLVTTIEELLANVAATPADVALTVTRIDNDGDAVVEARRDWVAGPPLVAGLLGLDSPPSIGFFYVRSALLTDVDAVNSTLHRAATLTADIQRLIADE